MDKDELKRVRGNLGRETEDEQKEHSNFCLSQ